MRPLVSALVAALLVTLPGAASSAPSSGVSPSVGQALCHRTLPVYPEIKPGTTSAAVRAFQCVLNDAGFGPVTVDGFYGPETQAAVKKLTDGFECCLPQPLRVRTWYWTILFTDSHELLGLEVGDSGIRVKTLQRALRADGETLDVDGDFGHETKTQVEVFQGKCDLKQTGRVNQKTLFHLAQGGCNA
jgi:peptidoglycan hydrolase-like protein with peptidoglycan-binding domain